MVERDEARAGHDAASFEAVFRANYARLCDFVDGYVHSREAARDLVQDLFLNLWERHDAGDLPPLTRAYLYTAARNRALKHLRHGRVVSRWAERAAHAPEPTGPRTDESVRAREVAAAIREAVDGLPDRCREIFLMSREQELSYAAIAEALGISIKTVETQMWRALKSLRKRLAPYLSIVIIPLAAWLEHLLR